MDQKRLNKAMNKLNAPEKVRKIFKTPITKKQREELLKKLPEYEAVFKKELNPFQFGLIRTHWRNIALKKDVTHPELIHELEFLPYTLISPPILFRNAFKAVKIQNKIRKIMEAK